MNKKMLGLLIAGTLGTPLVAAADSSGVTLTGRVQAEYGSTKINQSGANDYRQQSISDNAAQSRWGIKVTEDLGNGLSAIAFIDYGFRTGTGTADGPREQWVGLSSKTWGSAKFGRVHSPFENFAGGGGLDPFNSTNLQARGSGGAIYAPGNGFGSGSEVDHGIRYDTPDFSGFSAALLLVPVNATQTEGGSGGNTGGKGGANNYQLALKYKFGKAGEVFGGYSKDDASDAQRAVTTNGRLGDDENVWRIGAAWNFGDFRIGGQYENISNALAGNGGTSCGGSARANGGGDAGISTDQCNTSINTNGDGKIWFLNGQFKLGKTTLVLQGGKTTADAISVAGAETANKRTAKNITLGAIYHLSKRTRVFGGYQKVNVSGAHNVANTATTGTTVLAIQPDRATWSIGMRHDF